MVQLPVDWLVCLGILIGVFSGLVDCLGIPILVDACRSFLWSLRGQVLPGLCVTDWLIPDR